MEYELNQLKKQIDYFETEIIKRDEKMLQADKIYQDLKVELIYKENEVNSHWLFKIEID